MLLFIFFRFAISDESVKSAIHFRTPNGRACFARFLPQEDLMDLLSKRSKKQGQGHHQAAEHRRQSSRFATAESNN